MNDEKISGQAALAVGSVERQLERANAQINVARVYLGQNKIDNARWVYKRARSEVQELSRRLKHLDVMLRNNEFMPQEAPKPPHPPGTLKVIK